jgi:hypothetical protein
MSTGPRQAQLLTQQVTVQQLVQYRVDAEPIVLLTAAGQPVVPPGMSAGMVNATVGESILVSAAGSVDYERDGKVVSMDFSLEDTSRALIEHIHPGIIHLRLVAAGMTKLSVTVTDNEGQAVVQSVVVSVSRLQQTPASTTVETDIETGFGTSQGLLLGFVLLLLLCVGGVLYFAMWRNRTNVRLRKVSRSVEQTPNAADTVDDKQTEHLAEAVPPSIQKAGVGEDTSQSGDVILDVMPAAMPAVPGSADDATLAHISPPEGGPKGGQATAGQQPGADNASQEAVSSDAAAPVDSTLRAYALNETGGIDTISPLANIDSE